MGREDPLSIFLTLIVDVFSHMLSIGFDRGLVFAYGGGYCGAIYSLSPM